MYDVHFGSSFVASAVSLAACAGQQANKIGNESPNYKEAIRLYELAIKEMKAGLAELEKGNHQDKNELIEDGLARMAIWRRKIDKLKNGTYIC